PAACARLREVVVCKAFLRAPWRCRHRPRCVEFLGKAAGMRDLALRQLAQILQINWPGINCVKEFAMATIGLPRSASIDPVARRGPRAPARIRAVLRRAKRSAPQVKTVDADRRNLSML